MEGFSEENGESTPPAEETLRPSREALMRHACDTVVQGYLQRLNERPETAPVFTGEDGKVYETRHPADQAVAEAEVALDAAKQMDALAIEQDDYRQEKVAHVLTAMLEKFDEGFRRFAELYDENQAAAEALAERFPYLKVALAQGNNDEPSAEVAEESS